MSHPANLPYDQTKAWSLQIDSDMGALWTEAQASGHPGTVAAVRTLCTRMRAAGTELAAAHGVSLTDLAPLSGSKPPAGNASPPPDVSSGPADPVAS